MDQNKKKILDRVRRAKRGRDIIARKEATRLLVFRSAKHIYCQVTTPTGDRILASASSLESAHVNSTMKPKEKAEVIGKLIAERAQKIGVEKLTFDRSGYRYHGRVKALADSARANGLQF